MVGDALGRKRGSSSAPIVVNFTSRSRSLEFI
jgi:hypothetical protein